MQCRNLIARFSAPEIYDESINRPALSCEVTAVVDIDFHSFLRRRPNVVDVPSMYIFRSSSRFEKRTFNFISR